MKGEGYLAPSGSLGLRVIRSNGGMEAPIREPVVSPGGPSFMDILKHGFPQEGLPESVNRWRRSNLKHLRRGMKRVMLTKLFNLPTFYGVLSLRVIKSDGRVFNLGLASLQVVTTAGVNFITDAFQNTVELEIMNYHGIGTGSTAEAVGDTALVTEWGGSDYTGSVRATGTQGENGANVYQTVGTNTKASAGQSTLREHGIFSVNTPASGVLLDRTVFSAITLDQNDSLESTYEFTSTAGS